MKKSDLKVKYEKRFEKEEIEKDLIRLVEEQRTDLGALIAWADITDFINDYKNHKYINLGITIEMLKYKYSLLVDYLSGDNILCINEDWKSNLTFEKYLVYRISMYIKNQFTIDGKKGKSNLFECYIKKFK